MSEHYRRGDPETGCGIMVIAGIAVVLMAFVVWIWMFAGTAA